MSKVSNRMWERMTEMYGTNWTNKFGPAASEMWIAMLEAVDPMAIGEALRECAKNNPYPPTLPEFGAYLRESQRRARMRDESVPQLPRIMSAQERDQARKMIAKVSPKKAEGNRRSVLLPGESLADYSEAMVVSGKSQAEFRKQRLAENGWTVEDEKQFLLNLGLLGLRRRYGPADNEDFIGEAA